MLDEQTVRELNRLFGLDREASAGKIRYRWQSALQVQELGDFLIIPLTSSRELSSEGWNMEHCVAHYDADCAKGMYQVFSIRDLDGTRIATLGLIYTAGVWRVDQCLGFRNEEVVTTFVECVDQNGKHDSLEELTDLHFLSLEIVRLLNKEQHHGNDDK